MSTHATERPADRPAATDRVGLRSAYLYLVCLVTLVMAIVGVVGMARDAARLAYPDPGYYGIDPAYGPDGKAVDDAERARREQAAEDAQRREALLGLIGNGTLVLVAGPTYLYHWRRVQKEKERPTSAALPG